MGPTIVEKNVEKIPKFYFYLTFLPSPASMLSLKSESLCVSWILGTPTLNRGGQGGMGDDKQRPKHTKVINVPMSIIETHFLLPC